MRFGNRGVKLFESIHCVEVKNAIRNIDNKKAGEMLDTVDTRC